MLSVKVLVVEDDTKMRKAIAKIMKKQGYKVTAAADGESGLKQAQQDNYDLAIVDLKLPGIDGLEVLRKLKAKDKTISVVMVTSYASVDSAIESLKAGA